MLLHAALFTLVGLGSSSVTFADTLIVLNKAEATASLIDPKTKKIRATVPTGEGPHEVAASPDGKVAVIADYGRKIPGKTLTVVDVEKAKVKKTIDLGKLTRPHGIVWMTGSQVAVTVEGARALAIVDVDKGKVVRTIGTKQEISHMVALSNKWRRAFVANIGSGSVSVLDLDKGTLLRNITTGQGAEGIDITPDGQTVWITNRAADTVTVLDAQTLEFKAALASKSFPIRARVTPDGRWVLVSNAKSATVAVFDAHTKKKVRTIEIKGEAKDTAGRLFGDRFGKGGVPIGIVTDPDSKLAYIAQANADAIAILDLTTWKVTGALTAGKEPDGMVYIGTPRK